MNEKEHKKIEKLEKSLLPFVAGVIVSSLLVYGVVGMRYVNIIRYNHLFLKETNHLPTKQDTINFYQAHDLQDYIIDGNPIPLIPFSYKEIKRVVKEEK